MTWNELATGLAAKVGKPFDMSLRLQLIDDAKNWRSRLLKDTLTRTPQHAHQFYQPVYSPVELNPDPSCIPAGVLCPTYRTTLTIPQPLRTATGLFDYVGGIDGKKAYRLKEGGSRIPASAR